MESAFLKKLAEEMGNAGYCNYAACEEYLVKAWDAALEEAADVCDEIDMPGCCECASIEAAQRIRRLKEQK